MSEKKAKLEEDDLDDLDDYLDDFADDILSKPPGFDLDTSKNQNGGSVTSETETVKESRPETTATASEEDAIAELLKKMEQESPEARNQLQDLINEVNSLDAPGSQVPEEHKTKDGNLKDTISSTLNRLKQSGSKVDKSIKDEQPDQMLQELLSQMNLDGDGGEGTDDFDITKLLADMLDNLASKEILYDPLKDLSSKYPKWIEEHKKEVSEDDLARYTKQSEIVQSIVAKFEDENYSDSNKEHRKFINDKLEEMQNCGNPPPDLTGDLEQSGLPGFNFNSGDLPDNMDKELEEGCAQS